MKILCVADHVDPLIYSTTLKERHRDIDIVLGAGDLPMRYYGYIVSCLNKPLYFIFGNHNLKHLPQFLKKERDTISSPSVKAESLFKNTFGSTYIGGRIIKTPQGLLIAGLGGSRRYNKGRNQFTDGQMYWKIIKMIPRLLWNRLIHGRYLDILLTHASPWGINDKDDPCHRGFKSFLWFIRKFRPRYLIHGHIHLYDINAKREERLGETRVINAYDHIVIDTEDLHEPRQ